LFNKLQTKPTLETLISLSSREKTKPLESFIRIFHHLGTRKELTTYSKALVISIAIVDLPEPDNPVNQHTKFNELKLPIVIFCLF